MKLSSVDARCAKDEIPKGKGKNLNFTISALPTHCILNPIKSMKCDPIPTSTSPIEKRSEMDNATEFEFLFQSDRRLSGFQLKVESRSPSV